MGEALINYLTTNGPGPIFIGLIFLVILIGAFCIVIVGVIAYKKFTREDPVPALLQQMKEDLQGKIQSIREDIQNKLQPIKDEVHDVKNQLQKYDIKYMRIEEEVKRNERELRDFQSKMFKTLEDTGVAINKLSHRVTGILANKQWKEMQND